MQFIYLLKSVAVYAMQAVLLLPCSIAESMTLNLLVDF